MKNPKIQLYTCMYKYINYIQVILILYIRIIDEEPQSHRKYKFMIENN